MSTFMRNVKAGYGSSSDGTINFTSQEEAHAYFEDHWNHGASNEGVLGVDVECEHCDLFWEFVGGGGLTQRRPARRRYLDNDRDFF